MRKDECWNSHACIYPETGVQNQRPIRPGRRREGCRSGHSGGEVPPLDAGVLDRPLPPVDDRPLWPTDRAPFIIEPLRQRRRFRIGAVEDHQLLAVRPGNGKTMAAGSAPGHRLRAAGKALRFTVWTVDDLHLNPPHLEPRQSAAALALYVTLNLRKQLSLSDKIKTGGLPAGVVSV